jgi:hypothetical protein
MKPAAAISISAPCIRRFPQARLKEATEKSAVILSELRRIYGGPDGIRTHDLSDANRTLSQLSYKPGYEVVEP